MNRQDFLLKIQELFDDLNTGLISAYKIILSDVEGTNINYLELYRMLLNEYKYRTSPMPAWFAEKITQLKKRESKYEPLMVRHLREGKTKLISHEPEKMRQLIELPNGNAEYFYYGIVEDESVG